MKTRLLGHRLLPHLLILGFVCLQFGDVIFGNRSLDTALISPSAWFHVEDQAPANGWLAGSWLNRFPVGTISDRAYWDRPLINDPFVKAAHQTLFHGEFPWLSSGIGLGLPLFAAGYDMLFSLPGLFFGLAPQPWWDFLYLGAYLLSFLCMFDLFHRFFALTTRAALGGAFVFTCSGLFPPQMSLGGETFNIHFFVYGLWLIEKIRAARTKRAGTACAAAFTFLITQSVYVGMPEATVANLFMWAIYICFRCPLRPFACGRRTVAKFAAIFGIALLLSSPHLVTLSHNQSLMNQGHVAGRAVAPWRYLLDLFFPYIHGHTGFQLMPVPFPGPFDLKFVGPFPLFMLLLWFASLRCRTTRSLWPWAATLVFVIIQMFGNSTINLNIVGLIPVVEHIWFFRFFGPLLVFLAAIVTAQMMCALERGLLLPRWSAFLPLLLLCVYAVSLLSVWNGLGEKADAFLHWNLANTAIVTALAALLTTGIIACACHRRWFTGSLLALLVVSSNYVFSKSFFPKADAFKRPPGVEWLREKQRGGEIFRIYSNHYLYPSLSSAFGFDDIRYLAVFVPPQLLNVLNGVFGELVRDRVKWDRFEGNEIRSDAYEHPGFDLLNVRYFLLPPSWTANGAHIREVYRGSDMLIYENTDALPRFFLRENWEVFANAEDMQRALQSDPRRYLTKLPLLHEPQFPAPRASLPGQENSIQLLKKTNHSYEFSVNIAKKCLLVISDVYLDGYTAQVVGGNSLPIYESHLGLMSIPLALGNYRLRVSYYPPVFTIGIILGFLGALAGAGALWWGWRRQELLPFLTESKESARTQEHVDF